MIKLAKLLNEEQNIDELGVKDIALGAAMAASSMFGGAKAQSKIPTDKPSITQTATTDLSNWKATRYVSDKKMEDWNKFVDWLSKTKVEDLANDIQTERQGSGKLAGNEIMNHEDYSDVVLEVYKDRHPETTISKSDIKLIQKQLGNYRLWTISTHIKNGGIANKNNPIQFSFTPNKDYSNYMSFVLKSGEDGIVGINTSRIQFPHAYITDLDKGTTADLGFAKIKENKMTKQQLREAIRKIIKQELNEGLKTVSNPNAGKWRIVNDKTGSPMTKEFYNSKEEATDAAKALGRTNAPGIKIVQLKDTMKVHTNENAPAPSKPATAPGVKEPPVKTPGKKEPRRPLGNPNVKPAPKAVKKATMKEAEMLKQVIKRFKSKKNA
jgi:hypothetical protein